MHNKDGNLRRCLYFGQQFMPFNGNASFCCYGHFQMYSRGEVHVGDTPAFVPNQSFMAPPSPVAIKPLNEQMRKYSDNIPSPTGTEPYKRLKPTDFV